MSQPHITCRSSPDHTHWYSGSETESFHTRGPKCAGDGKKEVAHSSL